MKAVIRLCILRYLISVFSVLQDNSRSYSLDVIVGEEVVDEQRRHLGGSLQFVHK